MDDDMQKIFCLKTRYESCFMMFSKRTIYRFLLPCFILVLWPCISTASDLPRVNFSVLGIKRIAIDPGFGGKDFGAPSCKEGVYSKDVNLEIASKLAQKIREELHLEVIMTRDSDQFVSLEERTHIANSNKVDLFISIHSNAHADHRSYGIETYCLNVATPENASRILVLKGQSSKKSGSDLEKILSDLMLNSKILESQQLADHVQQSLYVQMRKVYSHVKDRGVKQAPFYVLIGTVMPSILVETSFISNPRECKRLISDEYQDDLAAGIVQGIGNYIEGIKLRKQDDT